MEKFKENAIKILEQLIYGYLQNFLQHSISDDKCKELKEKTIGAIQYAYYIGLINYEKFEYYIDRVYLEENKEL